MNDQLAIYLIVGAHWVGDWVIQPFAQRWMGKKNEKWSHLAAHAGTYGLPLLILMNPLWALINAVAHGVVDGVTSRLTHHFYDTKRLHLFWFTIGVDQTIHALTLFSTWWWLS